ncbi:MAG TPA: adenylate/guanylate cyclase domain-containing protein [Gaiellaceae bacterium]|nr:adenylate/guanylate cyclase domain-containing protein [Gaiellaceae bacterium]
MPRSSARRRLLTVLFLDIVGSTALAHELGDARWRVVLTNFRTAVRRELKRHGGREQGTEGDSFFATFAEPVQALRAAAGIASAVQDVGLDVRSGVHTGEVEELDHGGLGGIGVHIGARVCALAGPAEVMVTSTVKELVAGSGAVFDDAGEHELKGVEGLWHTHLLRSIDVVVPPPLAPEIAAERIAGLAPPRARRRMYVALAAALILVAAVIGGLVATRGSSKAPAKPAGRITLLQLDPKTGAIVRTLRDGTLGCPCGANLFAVDGTLWERGGRAGNLVVVRDMSTGRRLRATAVPTGAVDGAVSFGSVWLLSNLLDFKTGRSYDAVQRLDELSGRIIATIRLPSPIQSGGSAESGTIAVGDDAVWALQGDGTLNRIDPSTNKLTGRFPTGAKETEILLPAGGYEWICECLYHEVLRYDARTRTGKTFHFSEQPWHLVEIKTAAGPTLWLMDEQGATLTEFNPKTGTPKQPLGLNGTPFEATQIGDSIWVAAGSVVDRIKLKGDVRTSIPLPKGMNATGIAADPASGRLWVNNSYRPTN